MSAVDAPRERSTFLRELAGLLSADSLVRADESLARRTAFARRGPGRSLRRACHRSGSWLVLNFSSRHSLPLFVRPRLIIWSKMLVFAALLSVSRTLLSAGLSFAMAKYFAVGARD